MGFVEVAKEFRADKPELGIELHENTMTKLQLL